MMHKSSVTILKLKILAREKEKIKNALSATVNKLKRIATEKELIRSKLEIAAKDLAYAKAVDEAMLESIGDGLLATDEHGNISFINSAAEKLFHKNSKEVIGKQFSQVIILRNEKGMRVKHQKQSIKSLESTALFSNNVYYFAREDKKIFPIAITATPVFLEKKIIGSIEVFRDITREKEIDKAKSEFVSLTSHQLKNPATIVSLYAEQLLGGYGRKSLSKRQKRYLSEIQRANQRMIDIINTLLNVSRIEMGVFSMEVSEIDIIAFLKNSFKDVEANIASKKIVVREDYHANSEMIIIDKSLLSMVISNLISNAIKYSSVNGTVSLKTIKVKKGERIHNVFAGEDSLLISLADNGCGIAKDQQSRIFTKFFRSDDARDRHPDGTGLGLYIAKSILDRIGGSVWFESEENKGTIFYFTIPLSAMPAKDGHRLS
jgi:two-component system sensor histidine kinase VicK